MRVLDSSVVSTGGLKVPSFSIASSPLSVNIARHCKGEVTLAYGYAPHVEYRGARRVATDLNNLSDDLPNGFGPLGRRLSATSNKHISKTPAATSRDVGAGVELGKTQGHARYAGGDEQGLVIGQLRRRPPSVVATRVGLDATLVLADNPVAAQAR